MVLNGVPRNPEFRRNLRVRAPFAEQREDLPLPRSEDVRVRRPSAPSSSPCANTLTPLSENYTTQGRKNGGGLRLRSPPRFVNPENGVALAAVSESVVGTLDQQLIHFDFPETIAVTPGNTYFLEIDAATPFFVLPCGALTDEYAGGQLFSTSAPIVDLQFTTYSETPPPTQPPTPPVRPTRTPRR